MLKEFVRCAWFAVRGIAEASSTANAKAASEIIEKGAGAVSNTTPNGLVVLVAILAMALAAFAIYAIVKIVMKKK